MINMIKTIDTISKNRVNLSKQASKLLYAKISGRGFKLRTRIPLFRMWGDWYYLVSVTCDVYA